jgi:hypothetical protein
MTKRINFSFCTKIGNDASRMFPLSNTIIKEEKYIMLFTTFG